MTTAQRTERFQGVVLERRSPSPQPAGPMTLDEVISRIAPPVQKVPKRYRSSAKKRK
jgi:hypothetical protein